MIRLAAQLLHSKFTHALQVFVFIVGAVLVAIYGGPVVFLSGLNASDDSLPEYADIVHVQKISSSTAKYTYISDLVVPAKEFEDITRRTETSFVQRLPDGKERVTFTAGKEYREKNGNWYALAEATTTVFALEHHLQQSVWFTNVAFAESTTTSYTTSGTSYWVAPTGVTSAVVACWGAGGGGGDGVNSAGGGGGGGAFASSTVTVTPGTSYPVVVGAGGAANEGSGGSGSAGATSTFATTTVIAAGGQGGAGSNAADAAGGQGGQAASSTGDVTYSGGNGGGGTNNGDTGGGGGGAAGPHGAGGNGLDGEVGGPGCSGAGGTGDNGQGGAGGVKQCTNMTNGDPGTDDVNGGGGGAGGENQGKGGDGGAPGGGAGGGESNGGVGADGQCTITYAFIYDGPTTITSAADQTFAVGDSATAISPITIRASSTQTSISATNDLRIVIATSTVNMLWDTSDTTAVFGGTASANVSNPVSYEGGGSVLVIPVSSDFATSSTLTISGLSFTSFSTDNTATTALSVRTGGSGDTTDDAVDTKTVTIETAASTWDATNWSSYDTITIDAANIDADLTDFPVYVDLSDLSAAFWSTTPSASTTVGTDIRVTTDSGSITELPRELVFASSTTQTGELWFKADSISSTTDTVFRIYYNGTTSGDYVPAVSYGAENVWTNGYEAVYHLNEDPSVAGTSGIVDSTGNGNDGTDSGSMTSVDKVAGKTGYAFDFDGSDDTVQLTDMAYTSGPVTFSAWFNGDISASTSYMSIIRKGNGDNIGLLTGFDVANGETVAIVRDNTSSYPDSTNATQNWINNQWHYLSGVVDASNITNYTDGVATSSTSHDNSFVTGSNPWYIGSYDNSSEYFVGQIDEVRISTSTRSAAWIKAEYYNQATTTDFYTAAEYIPAITLSGTLYSDEGSTAITSGKTIKVAVGTSTPSIHTTTSNGSGNFTFTIPSANLTATNTPLVVWVDGDTVKANTFSKLASNTANLTGVNLYENHVIVRHEDAGSIASTTVTTDDMSFYDAADDTDIQYTASSTQSESLVVYPGNELYLWPNNNLVPVQSLVIQGNAGSGNDGSLELTAGSGLWMATGTLSIAGNLTMAQTSNLVAPASGILFTATTTGKTIETPLDATVTDTLGSLVFNGAGGGWTIATSATTTNFTITNGSVTVASGVDLVVTEDFTNSGTFTNNGELIIGPGEGWDTADGAFIVGSGKSVSSYGSNATNFDFSPDGTKLYYASNADTRVNQFTLTTPWDVSTLSSNVTFNISGQGAGWSIVMVPDGKSFYVSSAGAGATLYRYTMSTAWDLSTAAYTGESFFVDGNNEFEFSPDGTKFYQLGVGAILTYDLSTPWLVTDESASYSHSYNISSDADYEYNGMHISNDGTKLYTIERTTEYVHTYNLSVPWSIATSSLTYLGPQLYVGGQELNVREIEMNNDGTRAYIVGNGLVIYTYELYEQPQTLSGTLTGSAALGDVITKNASSTTFSNNASTTNLTINGTTTAPTVLSIAGDYTNNSIFQANNGEVVFDGSAQQTLSGTMTGNSAFYKLTLNNTSQNGSTNQSVVFGAAASTTNTMTVGASTSAAFTAGAGYTFQNVDWAGSSGSPVWLRSTTPGSKWYLDIPGSQLSVTYVDVQDSDATQTSGGVTPTYSINSGRNTNWNFSIPTWNATNWTLYDTITIDAANIDEDLTDFPVYVNLADLSSTFWSTTPAAVSFVGTDIRVTTDDGSPVELPRELVVASSTAQSGELHFKADSISSTTDTTFRIYYNGTTTGDYAISSTYGAQNVWTNDYRAVWHFEQNLDGTIDEVLDSTANGYHGTSSAMDSTDVVTGKLGGNSYSFGNGSLEYINMGDPADGGLDFLANQTFTVSFWGSSTDPAADEYALSKRNATGYQFIHSDPGGTFNWRIDEGLVNVNNTISDSAVLDGSWRYIVGGRSTTESFLYNNLSSTTVSDASLSDLSETTPFVVGAVSTSGGGGWNGEIDEVRVASTSRSNAWIKAEYYNQATTTDFYTAYHATPAWNATNWTLFETITIDAANIDADLTDFPVYVDLSGLSSQFWNTTPSSSNAVGTDIRITNNSNTELPRELVFASSTAATGELYFKADSISSTTNTVFKIWYNGTTAGDYAATSTYGAQNVWTNDYVAVWHMGDSPTGAGPQVIDSTANAHHGTSAGSMTATDLVSGKLGNSLNFDAVDDRIEIATSSQFHAANVTVSAWVQDDGNSSPGDTAVVFDASSNAFTQYGYTLGVNPGQATFNVGTTTGVVDVDGVDPIATSTWTFLTGSFTNGTAANLYVDDVEQVTVSTTDAVAYTDTVQYIGGQVKAFSQSTRFFSGNIDEVRVSSSSRSSEWVAAEYLNQSDPTSFYILSSEANEFATSSWSTYDLVTIDAANIDADLADFPVYIDMSDLSTDFWSGVSATGGDIRVTTDDASPVELPREIASFDYDGQGGELHFKADSISSTTDTAFRIYYGNATATDYYPNQTYGAQNVWTNGYIAVYHLNEAANTNNKNFKDSTHYNHDGTGYGLQSGDSVTGQMGQAVDFDGTTSYILVPRSTVFESTDAISVSHWLVSTSSQTANFARTVNYGSNGSAPNGSYGFNFNTVGSSVIRARITSNSTAYVVGGGSVDGTNFHYNVADYDGTVLTHYQDGASVGSSSLSITLGNYGLHGLSIGSGSGGANKAVATIDEVRVATTTRSAAWVAAEYYNQSLTTDFYTISPSVSTGSTTLANHSSGQVNDAFTFQNKTNEALFAFSLNPHSAVATTTNISVSLLGVRRVDASDFSNVRLYRDENSDAMYDGGDTVLDATGVMTISGQTGSIVFDADFALATTTDYLVVADWNASANGSFMSVDLYPSDVTVIDAYGTHTMYGDVSSVQHNRAGYSGGGGSGAREIGGNPPAGAGTQTGGGAGGGTPVDTNTGGETIGKDPSFKTPTAQSGSWTNGANAIDNSDGTYATDNAGATNNFTDSNFSIPGSNQIVGIEVKMEVSGTTAAGSIGAELSWNNGSSWTSSKSTGTLTGTDAVVSLGGPSDTWGRTWSVSDFSNANFVIRLTGVPSSNTVQVDAIQVRVYHQSTGGGGGGGGAI